MKVPAELKPSVVTPVVDPREQHVLALPGVGQPVFKTLQTGDYSVLGLEHLVAIERKSLPDLLCCCGQERERFERELDRLRAYPSRCLLIESTWPTIEAGEWRSKLTPAQVLGSLLGWIEIGIPVLMAGSHERAGQYAARLLYTCARRRYRELRGLLADAEKSEGDSLAGPPPSCPQMEDQA